MPSLVPGFEYDIFISYRQNDNRSGWVTEFVKSLQEELAATIKEPVSVYFDTNPHDGLLETHDVNKSLEGKLKCLIFIPIISQTYCDSKSFAWQNEFCAFNKLSKEDRFGRDIKLNSGNVASRILPVKIHDLDSDDLNILKNETSGALRAIEFIYKEPGVNRPLTPADESTENLNRSKYRNQVNKTANAIKEIITSLKNFRGRVSSTSSNEVVTVESKLPEVTKSLVVLPFENIGQDTQNEYFTDGITEDIMAQLSKISGLKVISRTTAMQYKKTAKRLIEISRELKISHALEGSVRKSGNRIRIVAQLIDAETDEHLWAETYDRELADVFAIQSEVAERIADVLRTRLTPGERSRIATAPTKNLEAYNLFLVGRHHSNKVTPEDFKEAIRCFERAIKLDPEFAEAYAWLAGTKYYNGAGYYGIRPRDVVPDVLQLIAKALELDPMNADAYRVRASIRDWYSFEWKAAETDHQHALELNPSNSIAHIYYAFHLAACGRFDEAMAERDLAHELDPASWFIIAQGVFVQRLAGRFDEAMNDARQVGELDSENPASWFLIGIVATHLRHNDEAVSAFRKSVLLGDQLTFLHTILAFGLAGVGKMDECRTVLANVFSRERHEYIWPMGLALAFMRLGEIEKALDYLEQSYEDRVGWMLFITFDTLFDPLRGHSRFKALLAKIGVPNANINLVARSPQAGDKPSPSSRWTDPRPRRRTQKLLSNSSIILLILLLVGYFVFNFTHLGKKFHPETTERSIAVLPFVNMSNDKEQEPFSDGMTDQIITNLAKLKVLNVIGRTSIMQYKGSQKTIEEIAKELNNVSYVLEGSIQKSGNRIKVNAQLIRARDSFHQWAEVYDRDLNDIFSVQDELSTKIAQALLGELHTEQKDLIKTDRPANVEAYEYYLKGMHFHDLFQIGGRKEDFKLAEQMFLKAISLDPAYASCYGALADLYDTYSNNPENRRYWKLRDSLVRIGYKINPKSAYVSFSMGLMFSRGTDPNLDSAFYYFQKAYEVNSDIPIINTEIGAELSNLGLLEKSISMLTKVLLVDPRNVIARQRLAAAQFLSGNITSSEENVNKLLETDQRNAWAQYALAYISLFHKNNLGVVKERYQMLISTNPSSWATRDVRAWLLAAEGKSMEALKISKSIEIYSILKMKRKALQILDSVTRNDLKGNPWCYQALKNNKVYDFVRNEPEFQAILLRKKKIDEARLAKFGHMFE